MTCRGTHASRWLATLNGLHSRADRQGEPINSFTIIVMDANELVKPLHDRMPVILEPEDYELWLDGGPDAADDAERLLRPFPPEKLRAYPVSTRVNSPENDDPACIEPIDGYAPYMAACRWARAVGYRAVALAPLNLNQGLLSVNAPSSHWD